MARDSLPTSLQETVLTTLCFDQKYGAAIAAQVEADHFDEPYREIARRVLDYRKQYGKPPGSAHLDDLFGSTIGSDNRRAPALRRVILGLAAQSEGLNAAYAAKEAQSFIREQRIKQGLMRAGERYQQGGEGRIEEVTAILQSTLRSSIEATDTGVFLNDVSKTLAFLDAPGEAMPLGIPALDRLYIGPSPGEMLLYIAPKGSGKSWFAVHCGKQGLIHRHKVLHITMELPWKKVVGRYYQSIFNAATKPDTYTFTAMDIDKKLGRITGFSLEKRSPDFDFRDPKARDKLKSKLKPWGKRLGNIVVKGWPTRALTIPQYTSFLDMLEQQYRFVPTLVIVDSPDTMKIPLSEFRLGTRVAFEDLRGVAVQRNHALVATTQGGRQTIGAKRVDSADVAEDIGKVQAADNVLTFAATKAEKKRGLGRLTAAHARNEEDDTTVLLNQSYATGQFVVQSAYMPSDYWDMLNKEGSVE